MDKFSLSERYRLELHWNKAKYERDAVCNFEGAKFSGPALSDAVRLNDQDHILIDFFSQYIYLVKSVYVAKFSWNGVEYNKDGTISLKNAILTHNSELNRVPKLHDNDYIVIDTSDHESVKHQYSLVYKSYVVNGDTQLYNFRR